MGITDLFETLTWLSKVAIVVVAILFALFCLFRALSLAWKEEEAAPQKERRKMIPLIGTVISGVAFIGFAAWLFWPAHPINTESLSDEEKFQRNIVLTELRQEYAKEFPSKASPDLLAGLAMPPAKWANRRLKDMGKTWRIRSSPPKMAENPGLFIECNKIAFPIKFPPTGRFYALNLFPVPLANMGGGIAQYFGSAGSDFNIPNSFGMALYECQITNYGKKPIVNLTLALDLVFQESVKDASNPNAKSIWNGRGSTSLAHRYSEN